MDKKQIFSTPMTQHNHSDYSNHSNNRNRKSSIRLVVVFIAGCAVGALVVIAWNNNQAIGLRNNTLKSSSNITNTIGHGSVSTSSSTLRAGTFTSGKASGAVSVINQPSGNTVLVQSVTVPPPGVWVAVREMHGKTLGNVLGAERVHGPRSSVTIDLLRNTEPNRTYVIELYRPNKSTGGFNLKTDSVYVDFDTSQPVIVPFTTSVSVPATSSTNL